jgi:cell shape-determining protein MreC
MKRIFLARRNAILSSANISWGSFALLFAVSLLIVRLIAPNFFLQIFAPVFSASDALAIESNSFINAFKNVSLLAAQNETLANEISTLKIEKQVLEEKMAGISGLGRSVSGVIAGVIAGPPVSPYDILVVSAGSMDGVKVGMEAFGAGGVPLGTVSSVYSNFSRITLFSAPDADTGGWVGHSHVPITLSGTGAGTISASAPRSANIEIDDTVFAPGPGMLPIGRVVRIDNNASSPSVTLRIMLTQNIFSITWVALRDTGINMP